MTDNLAALRAQLEQIEREMTEALTVGELFNPAILFACGRGAVLDWRDRLTALLAVQKVEKTGDKTLAHVENLPQSAVGATGGQAPANANGPKCINCGETNDGGYETSEGEVGPFCSQCWEFLRTRGPNPDTPLYFDEGSQTYVAKHTVISAGRTRTEARRALASAIGLTAATWPSVGEAPRAEAAAQPEPTRTWLCFDCDKWWFLERERCECGSEVKPAYFTLCAEAAASSRLTKQKEEDWSRIDSTRLTPNPDATAGKD